jgi:GntR family transcriptional repressor for pyruvate dehydrogenase complex
MADFEALVREKSLTERVTEALLLAISEGELPPGEQLPTERELSDQFQVSRTVIRETVRSLEAKGVLYRTGPRRVEITAVPSSRVVEAMELYMHGARAQDQVGPRDIDEVRDTIELKLVRLAAERATDDDLDALAGELDRMATAGSPSRAAVHDAEFHRLIAVATHNALFLTLLEAINAAVRQIRQNSLSQPGRLEETIAEHRAVLEALRDRDAEKAYAAMHSHLEDSSRFYVDKPEA